MASVSDDVGSQLPYATADLQIEAIIGPDVFGWAVKRLPDGVSIDDVRFTDLIDVSEDDVVRYVAANGFDQRVVAEGGVINDRMCLLHSAGRWEVFYAERGIVSQHEAFASRDDALRTPADRRRREALTWTGSRLSARALRELVRRQFHLARIMLNNRYWHAHGLPFPCGDG